MTTRFLHSFRAFLEHLLYSSFPISPWPPFTRSERAPPGGHSHSTLFHHAWRCYIAKICSQSFQMLACCLNARCMFHWMLQLGRAGMLILHQSLLHFFRRAPLVDSLISAEQPCGLALNKLNLRSEWMPSSLDLSLSGRTSNKCAQSEYDCVQLRTQNDVIFNLWA